MIRFKRELGDFDIPFLELNEKELFDEGYEMLGMGYEGEVRAYNDFIAFKLFCKTDNIRTENKFKKIIALSELDDLNACFPWGFIGMDSERVDGYFLERIYSKLDYEDLYLIRNKKRKLQVMIETSDAVKRFHNMGLILGDIKQDNIMIDSQWNVKFVDTDNWMYGDFGYDVIPVISTMLFREFDKKYSLEDNDKYLLGRLIMDVWFANFIEVLESYDYFNLIKCLNVSSNCREGLEMIMSDSADKPYIGDVLRKINPDA